MLTLIKIRETYLILQQISWFADKRIGGNRKGVEVHLVSDPDRFFFTGEDADCFMQIMRKQDCWPPFSAHDSVYEAPTDDQMTEFLAYAKAYFPSEGPARKLLAKWWRPLPSEEELLK